MTAIAEIEKTHEFILPAWWLDALLHCNIDGLTKSENKAFQAFKDEMGETFGHCSCLEASDSWWDKMHDAWQWVPLAGDVRSFTFDVTLYE